MTEEWREIPDFPDYEVSSIGRVRSHKRWWGKRHSGYLKPFTSSLGYDYVSLQNPDFAQRCFRVHRVVLLAFVGAPMDGQVARHLNGKCWDNRLSNLAWGSPDDNYRDRDRHGTTARGEGHGRALLSVADVVRIRHRYAQGGITHRELATEYGVAKATIRFVITKRNWASVPD